MEKKKNKISLIPSDRILSGILFIRGKKVMMDGNLAGLYQVEIKSLNRAVKRKGYSKYLGIHIVKRFYKNGTYTTYWVARISENNKAKKLLN